MNKYLFIFLILIVGSFIACNKEDQPILTLSANDFTTSIQENPLNGTSVGFIEATSAIEDLNYAITHQSLANAITIDSVSGELFVMDSSQFDFEKSPEINATIEVSSGEIFTRISANITVENIENIITVENLRSTVEENPLPGISLGFIKGSSNDGPVRYQIESQSNPNAIDIDSLSGEVIVKASEQFDYEISSLMSAQIRVISGDNFQNATIEITVIDQDDDPIAFESISMEQLSIIGEHFSPRQEHEVVVLNGRIWVVNGFDENFTPNSDVWSSPNGIEWTKHQEGKRFTNRITCETVVYDAKLWVIAGEPSFKDVWISEDGNSWSEVNKIEPAFENKADHQSFVFNNKIWVIGGYQDPVDQTNDVWSSSDGENWDLETPNAPFSKNLSLKCVVYKNRIWLVGGNSESLKAEVWSSPDGKRWELVQNQGPPVANGHDFIVYNGQLWVIGGRLNGELSNDIWTSTDGINWSNVSIIGDSFSKRMHHKSIVFNNNLYVIGGENESGKELNDIWKVSLNALE